MQRIAATARLGTSTQHAFAFLSALENLPIWMSGVRKVETTTDGPMRLGTQARIRRIMMGQQIDAPITVSIFEPPRQLAMTSSVSGIVVDAAIELAADGADSTIVTMSMEISAGGLGAFMEPMIAQAARADVEESLRRLGERFPTAADG